MNSRALHRVALPIERLPRVQVGSSSLPSDHLLCPCCHQHKLGGSVRSVYAYIENDLQFNSAHTSRNSKETANKLEKKPLASPNSRKRPILEKLIQRNRKARHSFAGGVVNGVCDGGRDPCYADLPDTTRAHRSQGDPEYRCRQRRWAAHPPGRAGDTPPVSDS